MQATHIKNGCEKTPDQIKFKSATDFRTRRSLKNKDGTLFRLYSQHTRLRDSFLSTISVFGEGMLRLGKVLGVEELTDEIHSRYGHRKDWYYVITYYYYHPLAFLINFIPLICSRSLRQSFLCGCPILECSLHSGKTPNSDNWFGWLIDWLIPLITLALGRNEHLCTIFPVLVTWPFDHPAHIRIAIHDDPLIFPIYQLFWYMPSHTLSSLVLQWNSYFHLSSA